MVIISLKYGDLSNRLFLFSHFIANAIEYDYQLLNPAFDEFRQYFCATSRDDFGKYRISVKFGNAYRVFNFIITASKRSGVSASRFHEYIEIAESEELDLSSERFIEKVKNTKFVIVSGWLFRDFQNFKKHSEKIRSFFTPVSPHKENVDIFMRRCKSKSDVVVGIHIRKFIERTYYWDDNVYYDKMEQIKQQVVKLGKSVSFLVCSNEKVTVTGNEALDITLGTNHFIEDLYSFAECDYLIGPPSTYSLWASFYGKVPLLFFTTPDQLVNLSDFKVV